VRKDEASVEAAPLVGVYQSNHGLARAAAATRILSHVSLILVSQRFEPCGRRCSVRPNTVRRPRLALGDGAATRECFSGSQVTRLGVSLLS